MAGADHLDGLDADQYAAVHADAAPLRILAGPGAGKTRVLTTRMARMAGDGTIDPRHTLAITFTRKAAGELRSRLTTSGIRDIGGVGTFHGIAFRQLRQHHLDHDRRPPAITGDSTRFLRDVAGDLPVDVVRAELTWTRHRGVPVVGYADAADAAGRRPAGGVDRVATALRDFQHRKRRAGVVDFDDLVVDCTALFERDPAFAEALRWRFRHFFVDEFQDVNAAQFALLRGWLGGRPDLCVVGDVDQAIYGWNGADARYLARFDEWWPAATTLHLRTNHRCPPRIAAAAAAVFGRVAGDPGALDGSPPTLLEHADQDTEASAAAERIRRLHHPGARWSDQAVLARTNDQLRVVASALATVGVPHRIRSRAPDMRTPEVRRILDLLTGHRGDLRSRVTELWDQLGPDHPGGVGLRAAEDLLDDHPRATGSDLADHLRTIRPGDLVGGGDLVDLCTFHSAKGLEWPNVHIVGVDDRFLSGRDTEDARLLYVGMTRALRSLHMSWANDLAGGRHRGARRASPLLDAVATVSTEPTPLETGDGRARIAAARHHAGLAVAAPVSPLLTVLEDWRRRQALAAAVTPEAVVPDDVLARLAAAPPTDLNQLATATGWGPLRCDSLGQEILDLLTAAPP